MMLTPTGMAPWTAAIAVPMIPTKHDPASLGAGSSDTDSDNDGTPDCADSCPNNTDKINPGICRCSASMPIPTVTVPWIAATAVPMIPTKSYPGTCGCGIYDTDSDNDGTPNCVDNCPNDTNKIESGICGCNVADADTDGDGTLDCSDSCPDDPNKALPGTCGCGVIRYRL